MDIPANHIVDALLGLCLLATQAFNMLTARQRARREEIEAVRSSHEQRLNSHGERITEVEQTVRHLPRDDDLRQLAVQVSDLHGELKGLTSELRGTKDLIEAVRRQTDVMDSYLRQLPQGTGR